MKLQLFTESETPVQTDIEKMEAAIKALKESGEDLFKDQIAALETKLAEEKAKVEAAVSEAGEEIKEAEQTFVEKYGNKIVQGFQLIMLGYIVYKIF